MAEATLELNAENEQVVLAALLKDAATLERELPRLRSELFLVEEHRTLLEALRALRRRGADYAADSVHQLTEEAVSLKYLRQLETEFDTLSEENFRFHVELLERARIKHQATGALIELHEQILDQHATVADTEASALSVLRALRDGARGQDASNSQAAIQHWAAELDEVRADRIKRFRPLYFTGLDEQLYEGLRPGNLIVVAGRPGMGKSTLVSNLTARQAKHGRRVLSVPVEAGIQSVLDQIACASTRLSAEKLVKTPDALTDMEAFQLRKALQNVLGDHVAFDDDMSTIDDLELRLEQEPFDVAILDLFEYLIPGRKEPDIVTDALRRVRRLGKRHQCCMIVVHQIRRIQRKQNMRPLLHELKNSGGYEEVADLVLLLHREKYYEQQEKGESDDFLEIKIAKQRRGPQNVTVAFEFFPEICRVGRHNENWRE